MFWGLIMEPQRRYTQEVKKSFHISMASLDVSSSSEEVSQIMCGYEGRNYLLCTLKKPNMLQCPLDLNFEAGTEVSFAANGKGHIHLTGYLTEDLQEDIEEEAEEDDEEAEEELDEEEQDLNLKSSLKKKRSQNEGDDVPTGKKSKIGKVTSSQNDQSDSDLEEEEDDVDDEESETDELMEEEEDEMDASSLSGDEEQTKQVNKMNGDAVKKEKDALQNKQKEKQQQPKEQIRKRTLQGGVVVEDIKEGQGKPAKNGKFVTVYYEGRLKSNNKMFDSNTKGSGFSFRLGNGEVIKGWDVGVAGMKPGSKRRIICPPNMAYGARGSPPTIPPNSTLVFEVELKKIS